MGIAICRLVPILDYPVFERRAELQSSDVYGTTK
jgi:hypothetical protein